MTEAVAHELWRSNGSQLCAPAFGEGPARTRGALLHTPRSPGFTPTWCLRLARPVCTDVVVYCDTVVDARPALQGNCSVPMVLQVGARSSVAPPFLAHKASLSSPHHTQVGRPQLCPCRLCLSCRSPTVPTGRLGSGAPRCVAPRARPPCCKAALTCTPHRLAPSARLLSAKPGLRCCAVVRCRTRPATGGCSRRRHATRVCGGSQTAPLSSCT
jgi:hypothetical protein